MQLKQLNIHFLANFYNQPQRIEQSICIISWSKILLVYWKKCCRI